MNLQYEDFISSIDVNAIQQIVNCNELDTDEKQRLITFVLSKPNSGLIFKFPSKKHITDLAVIMYDHSFGVEEIRELTDLSKHFFYRRGLL